MLDQENRQKIMLHQEGAILASVSSTGVPLTCEIARCQIDGITNALIRMEGAEETAGFVFALSDRVAAGISENTDYLSMIFATDLADNDEDDLPELPPTRWSDWLFTPQFSIGFACGALLLAVAALLTRSA